MGYDNAGIRDAYTPMAPARIAGEAIFSGCLSAIEFSRDAVASRLPAGVRLPPGNSVTYPCLLAFGEQTGGTTFFGGFPVPWGIRYHELMIAVPFVRWEGAEGGHLFVLGMACDFWPAVWNGNVYYGFEKRFARMGSSQNHLTVADQGSEAGFDAVLRPRPGAVDMLLDRIRAAAALPVLGRRQDGIFVTSCFDWKFQGAAVTAASLEVTRGQYLLTLPLTPLKRHDETCRIQGMCWRLGWPIPQPSRGQSA